MTQYRHLYWDSGNADLRMFSDSELEVLSYFLRKRYAALLDSTNTTPGHVGLSQPNGADDVTIGTAINGVRAQGSHTEPDDNSPSSGAEPDTNFSSDQTTLANSTSTFYQNTSNNHPGSINDTDINATGLLYWTSPDLKMGPIVEADLLDTLATHCLTEMLSGDEVGTYRVATSDPGGGTWSDKGTWFTDTYYGATKATYKLYLKTANTTEPSSPDNYIRWDSTNSEIQLESSTNASTNKLVNDVYLQVLYRRHLLYNVSTTNSGTNRGTFYDKIYNSYTNSLSGPSGGVYTRTYTPSGSLVDNGGPYYFITPGQRTP